MFHKVKDVTALQNYRLSVLFAEGVTKIYDVLPLIDKYPMFQKLKSSEIFTSVAVDTGGYGVIWGDEMDISCDELFENGEKIKTVFDGLLAFSDATALWGLSESTLRKAVSYGKLVKGIDVCKYGKQWIVSFSAMEREYGLPLN